VSGAVTCMGF